MNSLIKINSFNRVSLALNINKFTKTFVNTRNLCDKTQKTIVSSSDEEKYDALIPKLGGFAKAYEKQTSSLQEKPVEGPPQTFASMLRNSKFIDVSIELHIFNLNVYIEFPYLFSS